MSNKKPDSKPLGKKLYAGIAIGVIITSIGFFVFQNATSEDRNTEGPITSENNHSTLGDEDKMYADNKDLQKYEGEDYSFYYPKSWETEEANNYASLRGYSDDYEREGLQVEIIKNGVSFYVGEFDTTDEDFQISRETYQRSVSPDRTISEQEKEVAGVQALRFEELYNKGDAWEHMSTRVIVFHRSDSYITINFNYLEEQRDYYDEDIDLIIDSFRLAKN